MSNEQPLVDRAVGSAAAAVVCVRVVDRQATPEASAQLIAHGPMALQSAYNKQTGARMNRLTAKGFWGCTALVFILLFLIDRHYYVMPDAVSMAAGGLIATYLISWLIWKVVRWRMADRAPDSRYFVVALSAVLLTVTNGGHILGLLH